MYLLLFVCVSTIPTCIQGLPSGGKCTTSVDCVFPNVCSKWGWCQWTKIYGEDGPSQGSQALSGGRNGQCTTSADCAARTPYCSKIGFCHGGRLPFDEAQLEIVGEKDTFGYINNDPSNNSPIFIGESKLRSERRNSQNSESTSGLRSQLSKAENDCPGGSLDSCIDFACSDLSSMRSLDICAAVCKKRCSS